ncbi:hypothetical protein BC831DRAFT_433491 [Entophlyctis helioformis]|nr:hypothetical protein BC831DRAFT_433491 [Entophlyctis helioformis]
MLHRILFHRIIPPRHILLLRQPRECQLAQVLPAQDSDAVWLYGPFHAYDSIHELEAQYAIARADAHNHDHEPYNRSQYQHFHHHRHSTASATAAATSSDGHPSPPASSSPSPTSSYQHALLPETPPSSVRSSMSVPFPYNPADPASSSRRLKPALKKRTHKETDLCEILRRYKQHQQMQQMQQQQQHDPRLSASFSWKRVGRQAAKLVALIVHLKQPDPALAIWLTSGPRGSLSTSPGAPASLATSAPFVIGTTSVASPSGSVSPMQSPSAGISPPQRKANFFLIDPIDILRSSSSSPHPLLKQVQQRLILDDDDDEDMDDAEDDQDPLDAGYGPSILQGSDTQLRDGRQPFAVSHPGASSRGAPGAAALFDVVGREAAMSDDDPGVRDRALARTYHWSQAVASSAPSLEAQTATGFDSSSSSNQDAPLCSSAAAGSVATVTASVSRNGSQKKLSLDTVLLNACTSQHRSLGQSSPAARTASSLPSPRTSPSFSPLLLVRESALVCQMNADTAFEQDDNRTLADQPSWCSSEAIAARSFLELEHFLANEPDVPGASALLRKHAASCPVPPVSYSTVQLAPTHLNDEIPTAAAPDARRHLDIDAPVIPTEHVPYSQEELDRLSGRLPSASRTSISGSPPSPSSPIGSHSSGSFAGNGLSGVPLSTAARMQSKDKSEDDDEDYGVMEYMSDSIQNVQQLANYTWSLYKWTSWL